MPRSNSRCGAIAAIRLKPRELGISRAALYRLIAAHGMRYGEEHDVRH